MPRAYYASRISENISKSPEGYLICLNVPIARTGAQEYMASELGLEGIPPDKMVEVNRTEEEVFSRAALSSFEGKPLTDDHPSGNVSPDNVCRLLKGVCSNVRRGSGDEADKVVADLVVYDPPLISEIMGGKRGISCGYDCDYEFDEEGRIQQRNIRGNHVAVVTAGRAGNDVAIHDRAPDVPEPTPAPTAAPLQKRRKPHMSKSSKKTSNVGILGRLFPMFAKDADPEAVAEVLEELAEALEQPPADTEPAPPPPPTPAAKEPAAGDGGEEAPPKWAQDMMDKFDAAMATLKKPDDSDPLEKLEQELAGGEESVTVEAEKLGDAAEPAEEASDEEPPAAEGAGTDPKGTQDSRAAALSALRAIKPVIAGIKDAEQRKAVTDSVERLLRAGLGTGAGSKSGAYAAIVGARTSVATGRKTADKSATDKAQAAEELGRKLAAKHNPHYKGKE